MLTIGTRGSPLALAQTKWVEGRILSRFPDIRTVLKIIKTSADKDTRTSIRSGSATGVFVKEIGEALLRGDIDLAVHSMKDLPTRIPEALAIGAIPEREDARDALISRAGIRRFQDIPDGAVVGTGSVRRQAQILALRPKLTVRDIRGNLQTRLQKLADGEYDALVLASAGLKRMELGHRIDIYFEFDEMLPAPGQGALALEIRNGDERVAALIAGLNQPEAAAAVLAERAFLRRLGGGCNSPVAVHASPMEGAMEIAGLVASPDGATMIRESSRCHFRGASAAAETLADQLLAKGGAEILGSLP